MNLLHLEMSSIWTTLGSAVLHFLWQGLLIWCLSYATIALLRHKSAQARHLAAYVALTTCILCFITTCIVLAKPELHAIELAGSNTHATVPLSDAMEASSSFSWRNLAAWLWCLGSLIMALRMGRNWLAGYRLQTTMTSRPEPTWIRLFESLKQDMGVVRSVRILKSALAEVPMVVGWFRPVILIPASAFTSLTPEQMRIVLAHELSHIRHQDHLLNLLQNIIEVALFFHPVTWWLSRQIRIEREHCCDDACLDVTGSPKSLIKTLLQLESLRTPPQTNISLYATGGSLMNRIARLINLNDTPTPTRGWKAFSVCTAMALTAAVGLTTIAITSPAAAQNRQAESQRQEADSTVTDDQVRKRLDAAVANGSITQDQADRRFRSWQQRQQAPSEFPTKESMDEGVKADVERGKLTEMQAAAIMRVYARLAMGLENDKLSESDAIAILGERSKAIYEEEQGQPSITRQDYADAQASMQKMVDAGEITKEQMDGRLARMRKMFGQSQPKVTRKDYADAQASMQKMVDAGKITKAQMDARLVEMRKMIGRSQPQITRKDYADAQASMQKMVDAGKITKAQMDARLVEMRKMIGRSQPQITRKDYADAQASMQKMVDAGKITKAQMQQRLDRMKAAMSQQSKSKLTRKDYADAQASMQKMVDAGKITKAQMQQRLDRMKAAISQQSKSKLTRNDYDNAVAKMTEMVKAGKITREQMQQRLERMKAEATQDDRDQRK